jgi:pyruvate dehydrogenase E2 component (dihydrolipoamide acetyltransferase)
MDVLMPQLGETVDEGKVLAWYKKVGDKIEPGENLFEIETEKVSMEVPSTVAGTLQEIRVQVDETAPVGAIVAVIAEEGAEPAAVSAPQPAAAKPQAARPAQQSAVAPTAPKAAAAPPPATYVARKMEPFKEVFTPERNYGPARVGGVETTPYARRLAGELGISLSALRGSGPNGRIVAKDVEAQRGKGAQSQIKSLYEAGTYEEQPIDGMRRAIARRLTESKQTIPHFYLSLDCELDALLEMRTKLNAREGADYKLSVNDFVIKATALGLRKVPGCNASWGGDRIFQYKDIDISVAVAIEGGLITPIIRRADQKGLSTISAEMKDLARRAKDGKLKPEEFQGGGFSISNLGMYGIKEFQAVINPPQSCILAVGAGEQRPVVKGGEIKVATVMTCTLSVDHRAVDGALGAQFLAEFKKLIEDPLALLL